MVKLCGVPEAHAVDEGVTVIVAVTAAEPPLKAANDAISPVPVEASPIVVLLFVQV